MQLIATIIFFNDEIELLEKALNSVSGADRIVCVDGPYADWPHGGKLRSDDSVSELVKSFPRTELIEAPSLPYPHQIDKRNAYLVGEPGDWYVNVDADEELRFHNGCDWEKLKRDLHALGDSTAWLSCKLIFRPDFPEKINNYFSGRRIFKHVPELCYRGHHGRLWAGPHRIALEENERTTGPWTGSRTEDLDIYHNKIHRDQKRLEQQGHYYRTREHA